MPVPKNPGERPNLRLIQGGLADDHQRLPEGRVFVEKGKDLSFMSAAEIGYAGELIIDPEILLEMNQDDQHKGHRTSLDPGDINKL